MIDRIAAAPISWGICEVPGWGLQMSPDRVLGEMSDLGITSTELGALGWLPDDTATLRSLLDQYGLSILGGFVPLVLHHGTGHPGSLEAAHAAAAALSAAGGTYFVAAVIAWVCIEIVAPFNPVSSCRVRYAASAGLAASSDSMASKDVTVLFCARRSAAI